jgi:hypothetical protein
MMREHIWYEMAHARYWEQYTSQYIGYKLSVRKFFNVIMILVAIVGGCLGFYYPQAPLYACGVVALLQLIINIKDNVVVDNETISKYSDLRDYYIEYFNRLEKLWLEYYTEYIDEVKAREEYLRLRETVYPIERLKDALNISKLKYPDKHAEKQVNSYLKKRYNLKFNDNERN